MDIFIEHGVKLKGEIAAPPSKSYGQRALAASFLVPELKILNLGKSADELAALEIVRSCGAEMKGNTRESLIIQNSFDFERDININCHESGLCARLFMGLMLLNLGKTQINGTGSLVNRPINSIFPVLNLLEIDYKSQQNNLPISFHGKRRAIDLEIDGSISSQFVSGLLFYLVGLRHQKELKLVVRNIKSRPYIEMTIELLRHIGGIIEWVGEGLLISPSNLKTKAEIKVEGDWSSVAFWIAAAAIGGNISFSGLYPESLQADRMILDVVSKFGAKVSWVGNILSVREEKHLPFSADITDAPDLAPILAVLAIFSMGESKIIGVDRLVHKESNRLNGIINWLELLKIPYKLEKEILIIFGKSKLNIINEIRGSIEFESFSDHRMAMAASVLAHNLIGGKVKGSEAVRKSYPDFFQDFKKLGGFIVS